MKVFRRKPYLIKAVKWNGDNIHELEAIGANPKLRTVDNLSFVLVDDHGVPTPMYKGEWYIFFEDGKTEIMSNWEFVETYEQLRVEPDGIHYDELT